MENTNIIAQLGTPDETIIKVNIQILRIFVKMRHVLTDQLSIRLEIAEREDRI